MITRANEHNITLRENMRGGNGTVVMAGLIPALPAHTRVFSTITLAPGCSIGIHEHKEETELFYFVSGTGRAYDNGTWIDVKAGDAMSTGNGESHGVENTGSEDLVLVAVIVLEA